MRFTAFNQLLHAKMKLYITIMILLFSAVCYGDRMDNGKADSEELMDSVLPFAQKMLTEHGEFFPYGGAIKLNGEIISISATDGDEHPPSSELISLLKNGFIESAKSKEYKATALVYDARVPLPKTSKKSDAIAINLDHVSGYSVTVFLP